MRLIDINCLSERILFELQIGSEIYKFISLCWTPSRTADNFDSFLEDLILNLDAINGNNPFLVVPIGDFNASHQAGALVMKVILKELKLILYLLSMTLNRKLTNASICFIILLPVLT